ncbi:MAG: hypothetical protein U5K00_15650 [Melioribacteraceae bacterium]|nr:hypothetical protein [Melioribacteraceae bacterium]
MNWLPVLRGLTFSVIINEETKIISNYTDSNFIKNIFENKMYNNILIILLLILLTSVSLFSSSKQFVNRTDIGKIYKPGNVKYNEENNSYKITGSGENIWETSDAFYFVWEELEGDITLSANIEWIGEGKHLHRKAGLMIRDGISEDAPYVDVVIHGDGLTSMQFRKIKGGNTLKFKLL